MARSLIIGLGNPGPDYERTFHNAGVIALEYLAKKIGESQGSDAAPFRKHGGSFEYAKVGEIVFIRPLVFMNESGLAAHEALRAFATDLANVYVLHDETDLPIGEYKITLGGGSAGHKGVQSIIDHAGSSDFSRIRIGVRDPNETARKKAGDFVLQRIPDQSMKELETVFEAIATDLRSKGVW